MDRTRKSKANQALKSPAQRGQHTTMEDSKSVVEDLGNVGSRRERKENTDEGREGRREEGAVIRLVRRRPADCAHFAVSWRRDLCREDQERQK